MRSDEAVINEAKAWLRDAQSDIALSKVKKTKAIRYEHLCFHAEQAAEKSIKAVLLVLCVNVPRTHDIAFLMDKLPDYSRLSVELMDLPVLTKYAVQFRYPGQELSVVRKEYVRAVELAEAALRWASRYVQAHCSQDPKKWRKRIS